MSPRAPGTAFVSRAVLLETFGDAGFLQEVVDAFLLRCPLAIHELRSGMESGDVVAVSRTAHSLKGTLGYFDEGSGLDAVHRLEAMTADDLPQGPAMLLQLEARLESLTSFLVLECQS